MMNQIPVVVAVVIVVLLIGCKTTQQTPAAPPPAQGTSSTPDPANSSPPSQQSNSQQRKQTAASSQSRQQGNSGTRQEAGDDIDSSQNPSDYIDFSEQHNSPSSNEAKTEQPSSPSHSTSNANRNISHPSITNGSSSSTISVSTPVSSNAAMTRAEKTAELNGKLEQSMDDYDAMILNEREYIQNRGNKKGSEDDVESTVDSLYDDILNDQAERIGQSSHANTTSSAGGNMPDPSPSNTKGDFTHNQKIYLPPADIPSGNDDDVVARQIREAALKEADPKLRKKLWQEYRKYKKE